MLQCIDVLVPGLDSRGKRRLANEILTLVEGRDRRPAKQITDAQIVEMVWTHSQCIKPHCPLLIFGRQLATELNEYFKEQPTPRTSDSED